MKKNEIKKLYSFSFLLVLSLVFSTGFILLDNEKESSKSEKPFLLFSEKIERELAAPIPITVCFNNDDYGISGRWKTYSDDKLTNLNNWGPTGTDTRYQFVLYNFGRNTITEAALIANGCQIFYAGGTNSDAGTFDPNTTNTFSSTEKAEIKNWASAKNRVVIAFQGVGAYMGGAGYSGDRNNRNPNMITLVGQSVISGAFGNATSFNQGGGYQGRFNAFPPTACVITEDGNGNPTGLLDGVTGNFYFADLDMLSELSSLTSNNGISSNTDIFFANLMSSAASVVVNGPENACSFFYCPAGDVAPTLTSGSVSSTGAAIDLTTLYTGTPPIGTALTWHSADPVADSNYIGNSTLYYEPGLVYATYRALDGSCYSPAAPVNVSIDFPDLAVAVSPVNGTSLKGETQTYMVTVTNNGAVSAPEALIKVPLSSERELVMTRPSAGAYDGGTEIWNIGQLTAGQSETLEVTIRVQ